MSHVTYCWDVDCYTDGVVTVWSETEPTQCPNEAGHLVNGVTPTVGCHNNGQPTAMAEMFLHDGAGRVFKLTVDSGGALGTTQVAGP